MLKLLILLGFIASFISGKFFADWRHKKTMLDLLSKNPALAAHLAAAIKGELASTLDKIDKQKERLKAIFKKD
jgi:uncharacterized protein YneF (UPF0154 family)